MSTTRIPILALLALACVACDPPCEPYWNKVCDACGEASGACARAQEVSKATLDDAAECGRTVAAFGRLGTFGRARLCALDEDAEPNLVELTRAPFVCNGLRLAFNSSSISVGDERFETYDLHSSRFGVKMTEHEMQYCGYHLAPHEMSSGEIGLWIDCTVSLGALSNEPTLCLRERAR